MTTTGRNIVWIVFGLTSILTWVVYLKLWMMPSYHVLLALLGVASVCLGLWLATTHFVWRSVLLVVIGLVIGQWWLLERLVVQILWKFKGMAP